MCVVNGSWKQHVLIRLVTDWVGEHGWLWKIAFQFRGMNVPGETLTAWGRVTAVEQRGDYGLVTLAIGLSNQRGEESTPGTAITVWPHSRGPGRAVSVRPARARAAARRPRVTDAT